MEHTLSNKTTLGNQHGLTLLELLAVIVILGVIAAIAIPSIGGIIKHTKEKSHYANAQAMIDAARLRVSAENPEQSVEYFLDADLIQKGYLDPPIDPDDKSKTYDKEHTFVAVTYTSNHTYGYTIHLYKNGNQLVGTWTEDELKDGTAEIAGK
ncbi:type II secretion system protein [Paenibacillus sp. SAF-054]|uniref:type II secretion system protein n=1 Tax=unclassified Paenibacillus TaxID=185978 RepID=UPI003F823967